MVLRSFVNLGERSGASYARRRASNVSSSTAQKGYSHPFFKPSYSKPQELLIVDDVAREDYGNKTNNSSHHRYIAPVVMVTQNYVILDRSLNQRQEEEAGLHGRILLKKAPRKTNKNGHMSVSIGPSLNGGKLLSLRRSNSSTVRTYQVDTAVAVGKQQRGYSTVSELEKQFSNLKVQEQREEPAKEPVFAKSHHEVMIDQFLETNKPNEVLAVYLNLRGNDVVPSLELYNKILRSIPLRDGTGESTEEKLTHLLNVYSDMLSNNVKPSNSTYELVVGPLLKGAQKSYRAGNFRDGSDFVKIAKELFLISHNSKSLIRFNQTTYVELVQCLNKYQLVNAIAPDALYAICKEKVDMTANVTLFVELIKFAGYSRDIKLVRQLYREMGESLAPELLEAHQYEIYAVLIQSMLLCDKSVEATKFLDSLVATTERDQRDSLQELLSSYIRGQAIMNPKVAFETYLKFNKIHWLPDVSVASLLVVFKRFIDMQDFESSLKVWDMVVPRKDFDASIAQLSSMDGYEYLSSFLDDATQLMLYKLDRSNIIRITREIILKDNLVLSDQTLLNLVSYLNSNEKQHELATALITDQGYKKNENNKMSLNNYLSLLVDLLTPQQYQLLFGSNLFKTAVEQYRVVNDNIYGLIKIFDYVKDLAPSTEQIKLKLQYYVKVLSFEFEDASNHYVQLPDELTKFKRTLAEMGV
ncbi:hypothetical protein OGAPHI_003683 [Ogataea philodendri]|uniref:Uncharacterized protein n=1 Tax=Ogataea philodendri TaxID=1378263 RepID=A0A9P8P591_9ASCO|nr:uncharacterized protein OGAPHI_003683 [Ogataea philodendri]KAH3665497.1 hypothetical protein OGAPHI_003683 [Ogataea philodendri]